MRINFSRGINLTGKSEQQINLVSTTSASVSISSNSLILFFLFMSVFPDELLTSQLLLNNNEDLAHMRAGKQQVMGLLQQCPYIPSVELLLF